MTYLRGSNMTFCHECGAKMFDTDKFCKKCGTPNRTDNDEAPPRVSFSNSKNDNIKTSRTAKIYEGNAHTCRHCGESIDSFTSKCPRCGAELRDVKSTNSVKELYNNLNKASTEYEKISLIKTFPIPNSKEDIYEFMIMAVTNFDAEEYRIRGNENCLSAAWLIKIEQCYQKARLSFAGTSELIMLRQKYDDVQAKIGKIKKEQADHEAASGFAILFIIIGIILVVVGFWTTFGWILIVGGVIGYGIAKSEDEEKLKKASAGKFLHPPADHTDLEGDNHKDVVENLKRAGFLFVTEKAVKRDFGGIKGRVAKVSINGVTRFFIDDRFSASSTVVVSYYK